MKFAITALSATLLAQVSTAEVELPAKAAEAIKKAFPKGEIEEVEEETEDGKTFYEVEIEVGEEEFEVEVTADGKILSVEREIKPAMLPKAVTGAVNKKYPGATIKEAVEVSKDGKVTAFEVELVVGDNKVEASFEPDGKFIEEEKGDDDDDKDDDD